MNSALPHLPNQKKNIYQTTNGESILATCIVIIDGGVLTNNWTEILELLVVFFFLEQGRFDLRESSGTFYIRIIVLTVHN